MNTLVIRADASAQIGTGHVMRCLALAQAWHARGGNAILVSQELAPVLEQRIQTEQIALVPVRLGLNLAEDAALLIETTRSQNAEWIVVDGYQFDANYQRVIREAGFKLLVLDDIGDCEHYYADLILNQNLHATPELYARRESYTKLLLGNRYVLLRREFLEWRAWERQIPDVAKRILVTLGGSDPQNVTLRVMQALDEIANEGLESIVVVGATNPHVNELEDAAAQSHITMRVKKNATTLPALMAWADVAIAGAGSTCWELAFMGLPSVVMPLAENQKPIAQELAARQIFLSLQELTQANKGDFVKVISEMCLDSAKRAEMSQAARALIDGEGAARVAQELDPLSIRLRRARAEDSRLLWEWANDPMTRANSFSSAPISWETHSKWFEQKLTNENCKFFVAQNWLGEPIGQIRFEIENTEAVVSTSIAPLMRGCGYGTRLIACGTAELFATSEAKIIHAFVKSENKVSFRAFLSAGYKNIRREQYGEEETQHLILERNERTV